MRLYEIIPGQLYLSGFPREGDGQQLRDQGISAIVSVCKKEISSEVYHAIPNWFYLPIPDGKILDEERITNIVDRILGLMRDEERVLVHCLAGRNRASFIAALVYRRWKSVSGQEALEYVQSIRPNSIYNENFAAHLEALP